MGRSHQDLVKDPEDLLEVLQSLLLSFPLHHQLHNLLEMDKDFYFREVIA